MGFFRRLFGLRDPVDDIVGGLMSSIERNAFLATAPTDYDLLKLASERKEHISPKAVSDEYERLMLERYRK